MGPVAGEVVKWNPYAEGYFDDPHPHLHACRSSNPVQQGNHGEWILFKYEHIKETLRSADFNVADLSGFFKKKEPVIFKNTSLCPYLSRGTSHWLPFLNDDLHTRTRQLVESALGRFDLKKVVNECIERLFADHLRGDQLDATVLGATVPVLLFNSLYGGSWDSKAGIEHLQRVSHSLALAEDVFIPVKTYHTINEDMQWFFETVSHDFENNIQHRPLLMYMEEENARQGLEFTRDEMASMVGVLLLASVETSQSSVTAIIYELLKNRSLIDHAIRSDEIAINVLAEEFFRYITPQQYTIRINNKDVSLDGKQIPAGARLFLCLAAANRDPSVFPEPDQLVLERKNNPHVAFGSGVHSCIGSKLARTEMRAVLKPLASALLNYEIDTTVIPLWHRTTFIRGLKELRIVRV
jgi:cytochrome P450